jgi:hypothetical protein
MRKVLICGDSFASDWTPVSRDYPGWPTLLEEHYNILNLAQAGCSEYKILKQLQTQDLRHFDSVIVVHTSPFRIPVEKHPVHKNHVLHANSDFIYSDVKASGHPDVACITEYFEKFFWQEYAFFTHKCIINEQLKILGSHRCLHVTMLEWTNSVQLPNLFDFNQIFSKHRGTINHLTAKGNSLVFKKIKGWLG